MTKAEELTLEIAGQQVVLEELEKDRKQSYKF